MTFLQLFGARTTILLSALLLASSCAAFAGPLDAPHPAPDTHHPSLITHHSSLGLFPDDARLVKPVRLEANGLPLPEILAALARQTGVALESGPSVRELKAVALAQGVPLRTAMAELGKLFEAEWSRCGSGANARYVLARRPEERQRAAGLRARFWQRQSEAIGALLQATRAPDAQAALDAVNPTVARKWNRPQIPAALRLFDYATHGRYVAAAAAQRPSFAYRDLTPEQQTEARKALVALAGWREAQGDPEGGQGLRDAAQSPERLVFDGALTEMFAPIPLVPEMKVGERVLSLRVRDGDGRRVLEMGVHVGPVPLPDEGAANAPSSPASEPELARPLRLTPDDKTLFLHHLLPKVARQTRLALFADFFYSRPRPVELPSPWEGSLEALLRRIDLGAQTEWTLDGSALRLRNRRWYADEAREPPREVLDALGSALRRQGQMELDDCVRAAAMDDEQLDGLKSWAESEDRSDGLWNQFQPLAEAITDARPLLRLYGSLSAAQRRSLPTGLTLESLQVGQQPMFLEAALRLLPAAAPEQRSRMRLRLDIGEDTVVFVALFPEDVRVDRPLPVRPPAILR